MAKEPKKRDPSKWVKGSTFRLSDDTLAQLDRIAAALTRATGVKHTRTDAIRTLAHKEDERLKKKEDKS